MITELNCAMIGAWDGPFFEARQGYLIMLILAALPTYAYQFLQSSGFFLPSSDGAASEIEGIAGETCQGRCVADKVAMNLKVGSRSLHIGRYHSRIFYVGW